MVFLVVEVNSVLDLLPMLPSPASTHEIREGTENI